MAIQADALTQETLATPGPLPNAPGIVDCRHRWPFQVAAVLTLTAMQKDGLAHETSSSSPAEKGCGRSTGIRRHLPPRQSSASMLRPTATHWLPLHDTPNSWLPAGRLGVGVTRQLLPFQASASVRSPCGPPPPTAMQLLLLVHETSNRSLPAAPGACCARHCAPFQASTSGPAFWPPTARQRVASRHQTPDSVSDLVVVPACAVTATEPKAASRAVVMATSRDGRNIDVMSAPL